MSQPPSRHPLFIAIACIALAGAWSTGAYEAENGTSVALLGTDTRSGSSPRAIEAECSGPRGQARTLCLFQNTAAPGRNDAPVESLAPAAPSVTPRALRVSARHNLARGELR